MHVDACERVTSAPGLPAHSERIPGVDAWRAGLMLAGLLVHGSYLQDSRPLFDVVSFVSAQFRMGVFMVISGLLSGMAMSRREAGGWVGAGWIKRRMVRIAIPLLTGLAVTGPTITMLGYVHALSDRPTPNPFTLHHLWFLFALLLYLPLISAFEAVDRRCGVLERFQRNRWSVAKLQMLVFGLTCIASGALMSATTLALPRLGLSSLEADSNAHFITGYAPMFLMGFILGRAPELLAKLVSDTRIPVAALAAVLMLQLESSGPDPRSDGVLAFAALVLGLSATPVLCAMLVLRSALAIRGVGPLVHRLCDASLTMYIVHFPILAVLNVGFGHVSWNVHAEYLAAIGLGGLMSYGFHHFVVKRSRLAAMLFNGRSLPVQGFLRPTSLRPAD
ncbi:MAG TPA: acyltransferase family protein [Sphingomonas sp.]